MKYILLLFISFLSLSASAQYYTLSAEQQMELKKQEIRKKGVSEDNKTNDLFLQICRYVPLEEQQ